MRLQALLALMLLTGFAAAALTGPVTLSLPAGWSPLAFQCSKVTSLSSGVTALAYYSAEGYQVAPPSLDLVNAGDGGRRACWAYCVSPSALTYEGTDDGRGSFINLRPGWNMVSTASSQPATVQSQLLFYLIEANGTSTAVNVNTTPLLPGRAYWVFATTDTRLNLNLGPTITSLEVTPAAPTVNRYGSVQLTARGRLADGSTLDVSDQVAWTSSVPSAVGISPTGLATGLFPGVVNVTAALQGLTSTSQITVTDLANPGPTPTPRRAQLRVSNILNPATAGQVLAYASALTLQGTAGPSQTIAYQTVPTIQYPFGIALDPVRDILYVAVFSGGSDRVDVYSPANAAAPSRTITGITGGAQGLAVDPAGDRLYVGAGGGNGLFIYDAASTVNGAGTPRRITTYANGINAVEVDPVNNRLFCSRALSADIDVYDNISTLPSGTRAASVSRTFTTTATGSSGLELDTTRNQLYISNFATGSILVYSDPGTLTGTPATTRTISTAPAMVNTRGLFLDLQADELYVAGGSNVGYVNVFGNASTTTGTVAPVRQITGTPLQQTNGVLLDFSRN